MPMQRRDFLKCAAGVTTALVAGTPALAGTSTATATRADDFWFINTCAVPYGRLTPAHNRSWSAHRSTTGTAWQRSSVEEFFAESGDGRINLFFVHGHHFDSQWALEAALSTYRGILRHCGTPAPPIRLVIWKWPSERSGGRPIVDARRKSHVADCEGYKLGWFLGHMSARSPLSLVGFSFGPRIITGALHLNAGGSLNGYVLDQRFGSTARSVLWAPALDNDWLVSGHRHGRAIYATDRMLNFYNPRDAALRFYARLARTTGSGALGYTGMPPTWLRGEAYRYSQCDVSGEVNRLHYTRYYTSSAKIMTATRKHALWEAV